jgi:maltose O-acetyltransferase
VARLTRIESGTPLHRLVGAAARSPGGRRARAAAWSKTRGFPVLDDLVARGLVLGSNVTLTRGVVLDPAHCHLISIGDDTTFGPEAMVLAHDASTKNHLGYARIGRVKIGARVFIGARSIVLPGVTIGDDAIIGAGSLVSRDVAPGTVALGRPAKAVMTTEEYIDKHRAKLHVLPTYPREGWTHRVSMAPGNAQRMAAELEDTDGYVQ